MESTKVPLPAWLNRFATRISSFASAAANELERRQALFLVLFSVLYFAVTGFRAYRKLFWFDEIFTLYVVRLPDMASIWESLKVGSDLNPPLFYVLTRMATSVAGDGHLGLRIPEIVAFWIACLCLFRFVSCRSSVLAGAISMLFPLVTLGYFYSYEARPHGIVVGMAGLALVCWQSAIHSQRRLCWCVCVFLALAGAILNHAYGIFVLFPLVMAELTRSLLHKRIDWPMFAAIVTSTFAVLPTLVLWHANIKAQPSFSQDSFGFLIRSYQSIFEPAGFVLVIAMLLWFAFNTILPNESSRQVNRESFELPEIVAIIGFSLLPVLAYLAATATGSPIIARYGLSTVLCFGCVFGIVMGRNPATGLCTLLLLAGQIGFSFLDYAHGEVIIEPSSQAIISTREKDFKKKYQAMADAGGGKLPIVLTHGVEFLPVIHYAPPELVGSMVCLRRPNYLLFEFGKHLNDSVHSPGRAESEKQFLAANPTFLIYANSAGINGLRDLIPTHADVKLVAIPPDGFLYLVTQR